MIDENLHFDNTNISLFGSSHGGQNVFGGSKSEFNQMEKSLNTNPDYIYVELPDSSVSDQKWNEVARSADKNKKYSSIPPEIMIIGKFVVNKNFPVENIIGIDSRKARDLNTPEASQDMVNMSRSLRDSSMAYSVIHHINENKPKYVLAFIGENHVKGLINIINS